MTALVTSLIPLEAASRGDRCCCSITRVMFSMTTMASSTTRPVARVSPNKVSVLMEKPNSLTKAKVPTRETGMVIAGMSVERSVWRKT